jgi:hypothetical protein
MNNIKIKLVVLFFTGFALLNQSASAEVFKKTDTIYVGSILPNASLIANSDSKYCLMIHSNNTYSSIKLLDIKVRMEDNKIYVTQKLYNGSFINTDSVIINRQTLMPTESYSDISTSKDSFIYKGGQISGTMQSKEEGKMGSIKIFDTTFRKPLFNSLTYIETYQALTYQKNKPFYLAEYVPGHGIPKFTKVEYIKDEETIVSGIKISAKVLEVRFGNITALYWLNAKNQEIFKIEAKFPRFDYYLSKVF